MKSIRTIGAALLITVLGFGGTVMTAGAASAAPGPASITVSTANAQDLTHWDNGRDHRDRCDRDWGRNHDSEWWKNHRRDDRNRDCDHRRHW
jgi:hypothetical protein